MGFGIATLGYGFLLTYEAGGGIFAGILLAYGFYLTSLVNKRFLAASISALLLIPHSVLLLLIVIGVVDETKIQLLIQISRSVFYLAWLSMAYNYFTAIKNIAIENKNIRLQNKAMNRLYLTVLILLAILSTIIFSVLNTSSVSNILYVSQYLVILINILFLHNCFIMITTESQYKKDKRKYIEEEKKLLEKRKKEK
ncbi:MAG: hypothetical protein A2Y15_04525 [Clostridiales bacterium GWF2_36_10]|nr:MAG: hypothetical protein A2Y15_04525 [Clostridiales bacterium GWF2_36_10]HAN20902.1 hypothetical protein [Clostridiales bacterium]